MGTSLSESSTVKQMAEEKQRYKLAQQERIRSQLESPLPQSPRGTEKQNPNPYQPQPASLLAPQRPSCQEAGGTEPLGERRGGEGVGGERQAGDGHKERRESYISQYLGKDWPSRERGEVPAVERGGGPAGARTDAKQAVHIEEHQQVSRIRPHRQQQEQILCIRPATSVVPFRDEGSSEPEFDNLDWYIPTDKDTLGQAKQIEVLPSMTLVLSNKFNETMTCMEEGQQGEELNKNRRQIMRDLLAGRRETAEQRLLPSCNSSESGRAGTCTLP